MDQDETCDGGRPQPWPHCVRWGPNSPPQRGTTPQFSAHVCCGQTAGQIKMPLPLGGQVGLGPGDIVLDREPVPLPKKGAQQPPLFSRCLLSPDSFMDQDANWYGGRPWPRPHCVNSIPNALLRSLYSCFCNNWESRCQFRCSSPK